MKWIALGTVLLLSGCCTTTDVVQYRQVSVAKVKPIKVVPVVPVVTPVVATRIVTPVVEPVIVDYVEPIDVTTTTIDFY